MRPGRVSRLGALVAIASLLVAFVIGVVIPRDVGGLDCGTVLAPTVRFAETTTDVAINRRCGAEIDRQLLIVVLLGVLAVVGGVAAAVGTPAQLVDQPEPS